MPESESGQGVLTPLERIKKSISSFEPGQEGQPRVTEGIVSADKLEALAQYVVQFPDQEFTPRIKRAFEAYAKVLEEMRGNRPANFPEEEVLLREAKNIDSLYEQISR